MITAIVLLILSLIANGFLAWYIVETLKRQWTLSGALRHLLDYMTNYSSHVESVYNMELYYGDDTLQQLLRHSREAVKYVKQFGDGFMWEEESEIFEKQQGSAEEDDDDDMNGGFGYFGNNEEA